MKNANETPEERKQRYDMEKSAAEQLLKQGKSFTARTVRDECLANPLPSLYSIPQVNDALSELSQVLLSPSLNFISDHMLDWIKWLIAGGTSPTEFALQMKRFDGATTCGQVWTANVVAFRCRTCSVSPCMSLCPDCFKRGNHNDHDFNMFKSQAGGACDCGNSSVMDKKGFCCKHGGNGKDYLKPPKELTVSVEAILPRMFHSFIIMCRRAAVPKCHPNGEVIPLSEEEVENCFTSCKPFFKYLEELMMLGGAMRAVMRNVLINKRYYQETVNPPQDHEYYESFLLYRNAYFNHVKNMKGVETPPGFDDIKYMDHELLHESMLDELVFWMVKFEFPQKLVCFLLNMRPDSKYELEFATSFVKHYSRVSKSIATCHSSEKLCNSIVHVSVQLFSDQELAFKMASEYDLLYILILSIRAMISTTLQPAILNNCDGKHMVVNCISVVMKHHNYWPLVSDLNNILSSKIIAQLYIRDERLFNTWHELIRMFQGMNVNLRELSDHIEFEPQSYYAAFSAESEACASPMWTITAHMVEPELKSQAVAMTHNCLNHIKTWLRDNGFSISSVHINQNRLSFHIPLHRNYAILLWNAIRYQKVQRSDILPENRTLEAVLHHPLQVQAGFYDIIGGKWVRNGLQIKGQAITYIQCHFANSMVDADLFLLQLGAMTLEPEKLLSHTVKMFSAESFFMLTEATTHWITNRPFIENFLTFLGTLVTTSTYIGTDDNVIALREMSSLLAMNNRTHSYLIGGMPERSSSDLHDKNYEQILQDLSTYHEPTVDKSSGFLSQGLYHPRPEVWDDLYDPLHVLLRAVHRKDYQSSFERFRAYCRTSGKVPAENGNVWPPYRLPEPVHSAFIDPRRLISCATFQSMLFVLLYKATIETEPCETLLAIIIFMFELIVEYQANNRCRENSVNTYNEKSLAYERTDGKLDDWFATDDIFVNVLVIVRNVRKFSSKTESSVSEFSCSDGSMLSAVDAITDDSMQSEDAVARPVLAGSELVPYEEDASALVLPEDDAMQDSAGMPNIELPESEVGFIEVPAVLGPEAENPTRGYPSLLSGSEIAVPPDFAVDIFSPDIARMPEDEIEMYAPQRTRRYAGNLRRAISADDVHLNESFSTNSDTAMSIISQDSDYIDVNNSIISLLLKLHAKLSGKSGFYQPNFESTEDYRIGNGAHFVGNLLNKLGRHSAVVAQHIIGLRKVLYFPKEVPNQQDMEESAAAEELRKKKNKANERRKKVMEHFAEQQKHFLNKLNSNYANLDTGSEVFEEAEDFDCVICSQNTISTPEEPVGLIAFAQSSSILGSKSSVHYTPTLPVSYKDLPPKDAILLGRYMDKKAALLEECFGASAAVMAVNSGWKGGVHVQTCGHHLHLDCHQSYLQTLRTHTRSMPSSMKHDVGEFMCPLCRQLANCIIPVGANIAELSSESSVKYTKKDDNALVIYKQLCQVSAPPFHDTIYSAMTSLMEVFTKSTYTRYRTKTVDPPASTLIMFVNSIVRTNLEIELLQRGCKLLNQREASRRKLRTSHLMPLMYNLGFHSKVLTGVYDNSGAAGMLSKMWYRQLWLSVTQKIPADHDKEIMPKDTGVPLLFRDPITILLQIILMLPIKLDTTLLNCVMTNLYQLAVIRAVADQLCMLSERQRHKMLSDGRLGPLFSMVHLHLKDSPLMMDNIEDLDGNMWSQNNAIHDFKESCLHFLRIAALLKLFTVQQKLPIIVDDSREIASLEQYIGVFDNCSIVNPFAIDAMCGTLRTANRPGTRHAGFSFDTSSAVQTRIGKLSGLCGVWCSEIAIFASVAQFASMNLLVNKRFFTCRLLRFPRTYDEIFQIYYHKPCHLCGRISMNPAVCLACGMLVCFRENFTMDDDLSDANRHAVDCGAGTAIYLSLMQSLVYVLRGVRILCWGSLHLDAHGEEDRDLKRGKPLFIDQDRFDLLEELWINHRFDTIGRRWVLTNRERGDTDEM